VLYIKYLALHGNGGLSPERPLIMRRGVDLLDELKIRCGGVQGYGGIGLKFLAKHNCRNVVHTYI
jgi:hypothetical protein